MRIQNTSQYPDDEIKALVEFGMKGVGTTGVAVHVKNCAHAYAGMAYRGVPKISSRSGQKTVRNLVTLRVGSPDKFPKDNMVETIRWMEIPDERMDEVSNDPDGGHSYHGQKCHVKSGIKCMNGVQTRHLWVGEISRHPYGGKRSPHIVFNSWQEAVVGIAAHEARHIYQFRTGRRASEVDCERFALKRLEAYRASCEGNAS